jgi:hypothetical protein
LMTSKDFRFVLPLLPQVCLGLGVLVARVQTRWAPLWRVALLVVAVQAALWNQYGWGIDLSGFPSHRPNPEGGWPLAQIVATVRRASPHQLSTLAVLPDHERLNAFNLDAEGRRQQLRVAARQTIAPLESAGDDLNRFDWFLIKDGNQGVMSDERQARQAALVQASTDFVEAGRWPLPDGSTAVLMQRRALSLDVQLLPQCDPGSVKAGVQLSPEGLSINLLGSVRSLDGAALLIDAVSTTGANSRADQSVGQGMLRLEDMPASQCIRIEQRLGLPTDIGEISRIQLVQPTGQIQALDISHDQEPTPNNGAFLNNRVTELQKLGAMLRRGELDAIFQTVGPLNQSDPQQAYLSDSEKILSARLRQQPSNLNDLYGLALAQALQRRATAAAATLNSIIKLDSNNPNGHLALGFVELYQFRPGSAERPLQTAAALSPNNKTIETLLRVQQAMSGKLFKALGI